MAGAPTVDVVILTWNDGPLLAAAVASVLGSVDVITRVIVVDNGSDPEAEVPDADRLIRCDQNRGVAAGRNLGVRAGTAEFCCVLDSDARLRPHTLARLVSAVEPPGVGLVAPVFAGQLPTASAGRAPGLARKSARVLGLTSRYRAVPILAGTWEVEFAIGACQVFRREAFEAVGGLDEAFFYGPEDVDFCLRLRRAGWKIMQVDVECDHPPRRRHRSPLTAAGMRHTGAVLRHLWRHRRVR